MKENEIQVLGYSPKRESLRRHWPWLAVAAVILLIIGILIGKFAIRDSRIPEHQYGENTIDSTLQVTVDSLLKDKMTEICAISGQAIVMEVSTGEVRAMVGLQRRFDGEPEPCRNFGYQQESGLMKLASTLVLLETGNYDLGNIVDTKEGIVLFDGIVIKDHNWHRGGYGKITLEEAILFDSNIGICSPLWEQYRNNPRLFFESLEHMGVGKPDSIFGIEELKPIIRDSINNSMDLLYQANGQVLRMAPLQILTFYNAIANDGCMIKPHIYVEEPFIINSQIADSLNIKTIQAVLRKFVINGLGKKANTEKVEVAGYTGQADLSLNDEALKVEEENHDFNVQFCGYFPAQRPRYSIIVSMNKHAYPASGGGQAAPVFRQIVEYMVDRGM